MALNLCTLPDNASCLGQILREKKSQRVSELETQTVGSMLGCSQFTKGHNSIKTVNGVIVLNLCTSSDDALYLYQVSRKYLEGFKSY